MTSRSFKRDTRHRVVDKKYVRGNIAILELENQVLKSRLPKPKFPDYGTVESKISIQLSLRNLNLLLEVGGDLVPAEGHVPVSVDLLEHVHRGRTLLSAVQVGA